LVPARTTLQAVARDYKVYVVVAGGAAIDDLAERRGADFDTTAVATPG
jgi:hypothetical protein